MFHVIIPQHKPSDFSLPLQFQSLPFPYPANMENGNSHNSGMLWFFKAKGFDDKSINDMFKKCNRLERVQKEKATENWDYLKAIGIKERKLPSVVTKCPKVLALNLDQNLIPVIQCLKTLETKRGEVANAIAKFPPILSHSVEEKLCPLLAFFQAFGIPDKNIGKMLLLNPRIISYSIESKLSQIVDFLASLGMNEEGMIGKVLVKNPFIMGYSVEKRLKPTLEFLKSIGLSEPDLKRVAFNFPEVLCRDVDKILRPNFEYLKRCGFGSRQVKDLVSGYPPILIKSINNSLEPRIKFLLEVMGRKIEEVVEYPDFFSHGLKKKLEFRQKLLKQKNIHCSLREMLELNQKKFLLKYSVIEQIA